MQFKTKYPPYIHIYLYYIYIYATLLCICIYIHTITYNATLATYIKHLIAKKKTI